MSRRAVQLGIVRALNRMCLAVDEVLYRPAVVKLTQRLPRWWNCGLAHVSMKLDDRWGTGYWDSDAAPAAPNGPCDACGRRASWLVVGGVNAEDGAGGPAGEQQGDYLAGHQVQLCGWCRLDTSTPPADRAALDRILAEARARSVSWSWRMT